MLGMGASRKGMMSCLLKAGKPCTHPATFAAASVACGTTASAAAAAAAICQYSAESMVEVSVAVVEHHTCQGTHHSATQQRSPSGLTPGTTPIRDGCCQCDATLTLLTAMIHPSNLNHRPTHTTRHLTPPPHPSPPPHHAAACPHGCRGNVWHNDSIGQVSQPWLHGGLILIHIQACGAAAAAAAAAAAEREVGGDTSTPESSREHSSCSTHGVGHTTIASPCPLCRTCVAQADTCMTCRTLPTLPACPLLPLHQLGSAGFTSIS
jgi:hypothetical protein